MTSAPKAISLPSITENARRASHLLLAGLAVLAAVLVAQKASAAGEVDLTVTNNVVAQSVPPLLRYGGTMWSWPRIFNHIDTPVDLFTHHGTYRIGLGDLVLRPSQNFADLVERLERFPTAKFAQEIEAAGGRVVVSFNGMPKWLSSKPNYMITPTRPGFQHFPPRDYALWEQVVETIVSYLNRELGLNPYYEVWNEPPVYFGGTVQDYLAVYRSTARAVKRVAPGAKVGGPTSQTYYGEGTALYDDNQPLIKRVADFAAAERLPLDFISWHDFYEDPDIYYKVVVSKIRQWTRAFPNAELIIDEWSAWAMPPYNQGDLNAGYFGASYVSSSLLAMAEAGIDRQAFFLVLDNNPNITGGTMINYGLGRANHQVFRLFDRLNGQMRKVNSNDTWVDAAAFSSGNTLQVVVTVFQPPDFMYRNTLGWSDREFDACGASCNQEYQDYLTKLQVWAGGVDLRLALPFESRLSSAVDHYELDQDNLIPPAEVDRIGARLGQYAKAKNKPAFLQELNRQNNYYNSLADTPTWRQISSDGTLTVRVRPLSTHLFVFHRQ